MGLVESDMYPYIRRNLIKKYPKYKGWQIYPQDSWKKSRPDFVVERRNKKGEIERVIVEAKLRSRISRRHISQLNTYARNLSGNNTYNVEKILAVPSFSDVSEVPEDISIMYLRKFWCEDDYIYYDE